MTILVSVGTTPIGEGDLTARQVVAIVGGILGTVSLVVAVCENLFLRPRWLLPPWMRDGFGQLSREVIRDRPPPW